MNRVLGTGGLATAPIGVGCMGMSQGYGERNDRRSADTLQRAVELGITFWDSAQSYGSGHNEMLIGTALAGRRDQIQLATKVGIVRGPDGVRVDAHPERIRSYCEASLRRLGTEFIDLYYLHRVDPAVPIEESIGAMQALVVAGKVRHLGVCEVTPKELERAAAVHPIAAVQLEWSLWWREPEDDVIPTARRLGIGIVPYCPLGRGFLTDAPTPASFGPSDMRNGDGRFVGKDGVRNRQIRQAVCALAAELSVSTAQISLAWLLSQGDDVIPIPGARQIGHLEENSKAADLRLSRDAVVTLEAVAGRQMWAGDRRSFAARHLRRTAQP